MAQFVYQVGEKGTRKMKPDVSIVYRAAAVVACLLVAGALLLGYAIGRTAH